MNLNKNNELRSQFNRSEDLPALPILESYWVRPGYLLAGEYPVNQYKTELSRKRIDCFLIAGFDFFINLTGQNELPDYKEFLQEQAEYFQLKVNIFHYPVGDFGIPDPIMMMKILNTIDDALNSGHKVYYHCYAGIGRTGTVTGCYLVKHGLSGNEALQTLAQWWKMVPKSALSPNSPETNLQMKFILEWAKYK